MNGSGMVSVYLLSSSRVLAWEVLPCEIHTHMASSIDKPMPVPPALYFFTLLGLDPRRRARIQRLRNSFLI